LIGGEGLCAAPALDVEISNINDLVNYFSGLRAIGQCSLIIVPHGAAGDSPLVHSVVAAPL